MPIQAFRDSDIFRIATTFFRVCFVQSPKFTFIICTLNESIIKIVFYTLLSSRLKDHICRIKLVPTLYSIDSTMCYIFKRSTMVL